jgi:hypothetical protein
MNQMTRRQLVHALNAGNGRKIPTIWPYIDVEGDTDTALRCYGDQHRAELQVGAPTPRDLTYGENQTRRKVESDGKAESARLNDWLTSNAKALPKTFMIADILGMVPADVFDQSSIVQRRQLIIARGLGRFGCCLVTKESKGGVWARKTDASRVVRTSHGRTTLLEVPASLRTMRARTKARQKAWAVKRGVRRGGVIGTMAATEIKDQAEMREGWRVRQQRCQDRKAGREIEPFEDGRVHNGGLNRRAPALGAGNEQTDATAPGAGRSHHGPP